MKQSINRHKILSTLSDAKKHYRIVDVNRRCIDQYVRSEWQVCSGD